jgi:hypothetical protein
MRVDEWRESCRLYLPFISDDAKWRLSRAIQPDDPEQGWKLHVSATLLTAGETLRRVAPMLRDCGALFKAPVSPQELSKINSGLDYGYSQVGKVITIYPRDNEEAVRLARRLHDLTRGMPAPAVPFDRRFRPGSCVYYRYGGFKSLDIVSSDGEVIPAVRNPEGELVPDSRVTWASDLTGLSDPFEAEEKQQPAPISPVSPLKTTFRVFRALTQRGKGGVYQAIDLRSHPPRLCILKEGRRNGETGMDGQDGSHGTRHEAQVLYGLQSCGVKAPRVYSTFEVEGNYYLAMEHIAGESLHSILMKRQRRLPIKQALRYVIQISEIVAQLHAAGWAWRDCKPGNLILTDEGIFRPIDFESACPCDRPDLLHWGTPEYMPPESVHGASGGADDLYAIGAILYLLITGRTPAQFDPTPATKYRRDIHAEILSVISALLAPEPQQRPGADAVSVRLRAILRADQ